MPLDFGFKKDISGCGLVGFINTNAQRESGERIIAAIEHMEERGNGLGGGFAAYGIYPEWPDHHAIHLLCESEASLNQAGEYLSSTFEVAKHEPIPVDPIPEITGATSVPILHRLFARPRPPSAGWSDGELHDYVVRCVMHVNQHIEGAFVMSCGANMGVFKAVGQAHDVGRFYRLQDYSAYTWTAHNRFPTNTQAWWGGAHPFSILDWTVVHNGEISSYGANRRYVEQFGYVCTLHTDTEVLAYLWDLLVRRHRLPVELAAKVVAPPFWSEIERMDEPDRELHSALRAVYASAQVNGPFAIIVAWSGGMVGLNDRVKLRPMVAAWEGSTVYVSSEESAIRAVAEPEELYVPVAGEPVVALLHKSDSGSDGS